MSIKFSKVKQCLELDDLIAFGKHSGRTISYMLQFEPEYLLWATKQSGLLYLSSTIALQLEEYVIRAKLEKEKQKWQKFVKEHVAPDFTDFSEDVPF